MRKRARPLPCFDSRSVLLFAALSLGGTSALQAQGMGSPSSSRQSTSPANTAPTPATKVPPMTASPAFGPNSHADEGTGGANNPDQRPSIDATEPT